MSWAVDHDASTASLRRLARTKVDGKLACGFRAASLEQAAGCKANVRLLREAELGRIMATPYHDMHKDYLVNINAPLPYSPATSPSLAGRCVGDWDDYLGQRTPYRVYGWASYSPNNDALYAV